ncbi:hypothetical protein HQ560_00185, partial [bacterium]|nr:hypothetical protein [bacterium]
VLYRSAAAIGLGAALWASFAAMAMPAIDAPDHYMALLPAAVIGGVAGMLLPKFVMTLSTALFGGVAAAACGFALIAKRSCASVVVRVAPDEAFTQGAYNRIYFLGCAALLVTAALVLQDRMSESPRIADK